ncbi:hypothetical protein CTA1_6584 [Colletotrichum tanaceti]|uniref:Uncharacterized protein n=1 Tax=Colletotrichum tanaceti TaxID=1306861 RepID=A0A4U6X394_9PEZI|nr:hypothetical protein CTA1_6584 [Colletotrichum tanaceti]
MSVTEELATLKDIVAVEVQSTGIERLPRKGMPVLDGGEEAITAAVNPWRKEPRRPLQQDAQIAAQLPEHLEGVRVSPHRVRAAERAGASSKT